MGACLLLERQGQTAKVILNRPESLNSLNGELAERLTSALNELGGDDSIRVIILTGAGRAFCAGGDLDFLSSLKTTRERKNFITAVGNLAQIIISLKKPVIAMVNGVAAGAGANLMLACDIILAAEGARFAQSFVKVGLIPDCGGLYLLPRAVGIHKAKELMFTADLVNAEEALRYGMVNQVYSAEQLAAETAVLAEKIAAAAPEAIAQTKLLLNKRELPLEALLAWEADAQALCLESEDCAEGIAAFRTKRSPVFTGK